MDIATPTDDAPEKTHLRIGYVALSDAAPLIAAKVLEFGHRHGLTLELCLQPSWAAVRDKLLSGQIDCAHALYGLVYGIDLGIGGPRDEMAILMVLNRNGQAITLSTQLARALDTQGDLKRALATLGRPPIFAQTFPTGTHALWLYYWLAAHGVHPRDDIESVVIPPPQMVDALARGTLDGFCAGEPWHAVAEARGAGETIVATSEIWPNHPEKVLACRREFVDRYPATARALVRAMLEACRWVDAPVHRDEISSWLAQPEALDVPRELIASRLTGREGGKRYTHAPLPVAFFDGGTVNYPRVAEGRWFLAQYRRWGLLSESDVPAMRDEAIAARVNQTTLYREAAALVDVPLPATDETYVDIFCDGAAWR
ncbi:CmpA/NrtA family ABC transporter substrate-binding protein [Trinickia acidisoli]|uniref:CmpA/NrtA family ABC transporter substrate-binding protein n=1 Tax=Trinickia acidisoli TaxID=2767482 RepID=UPI001A90B85D|nr:CmpA/NrtA family ABC transporter substrate-binding protein [Trinickia acidisoli]